MWSRREFLRRFGVACSGSVALGQTAPGWWGYAAAAAEATGSGRKLVVIELQGGNDGLNTVIPFADDAYYRARPTLAIAAGEVIKLDDHLGLHPAMKPWKKLWGDGQLAIVENCGYPQPNRSHFESMDIWHGAELTPHASSGWLGRAADASADCDICYVGEGALPRALSRRDRSVVALEHLSDLRLRADAGGRGSFTAESNSLAATIAQRMEQARELSGRLPGEPQPTPGDAIAAAAAAGNDEPLTQRLGVIRTLLEKDEPFSVYYTALDGFDTHGAQRNTHESLWEQTSKSVADFLAELKRAKRSQDVAVFLFSEFGRRVHENGSQGTDHGAAAPVFLLGEGVRGGLQGGVPDLTDLDDGDLRHKVDFRDVYAGLLAGWLGVEPAGVIQSQGPRLELFGRT